MARGALSLNTIKQSNFRVFDHFASANDGSLSLANIRPLFYKHEHNTSVYLMKMPTTHMTYMELLRYGAVRIIVTGALSQGNL